jgi:transcriptional regulator with XRE-family HTH domain
MARLGRAHRALRHRLGQTQQDAADSSGLSRAKVSQLENHRLEKLSLPELDRSFAALGATLIVGAHWKGAALDRLLDEGHARLVGHVGEELRRCGWEVAFEVTFSEFGERGSIDILGWKAAERALLVTEIKSEMGSMDGLLRPLDVKVRLAPKIARERFGWSGVATVSRLVVMPEDSTQRRLAARHASVLAKAFPIRSREVRRWLQNPLTAMSALWFLSAAQTVNATRNPSAIQRVRKPKSKAA